jgi:hypothetical protein
MRRRDDPGRRLLKLIAAFYGFIALFLVGTTIYMFSINVVFGFGSLIFSVPFIVMSLIKIKRISALLAERRARLR